MIPLKKVLILSLMCLCLTGCTDFLERSYRVVEPYADRYYSSDNGESLYAETYQELVNSLLMLVEEGAITGSVEYYQPTLSFLHSQQASREVLEDTAIGSYLLNAITSDVVHDLGFSTITFYIDYRQGVLLPDILLTDTDSLKDLLRVYLREGHSLLSAAFSPEPAEEEIYAIMDALWQELVSDGIVEESEPYPWTVTCYPKRGTVGIVEIQLTE